MNFKWIGAILVFLSCGGCGFSIAATYRKEENAYQEMIRILSYMKAELQYHLTALPDLCDYAADETDGPIRSIFMRLSEELKTWTHPDAADCMRKILRENNGISSGVRKLLLELGNILGQFDLHGQIEGIDMVKRECEEALKRLSDHREERMRSYRTLGLCAGAALVILFI